MNTCETLVFGPASAEEDDLLRLEMKVAQRADELRHGIRGRDLECWLQAEREIFGPDDSAAC